MLTISDDPSASRQSCTTGGESRGTHLSRDGDASLGDDGGDADDDDDGDKAHEATVSLISQSTSLKKKKRKSQKKKKISSSKQSSPPRVPVSDLFPTGEYPVGEIQEYVGNPAILVENTSRAAAEELRYHSRGHQDDNFLNDYRKAAEVHRQVRHWAQETIRPGQTLTQIAVGIEDGVRALLDNAGLERGSAIKSGIGFPTGLALNNCVAHYTPNPGQKEVVLQASDVTKVDFGVHINGWIVDSAFTMSFDPTYDNLLAAVKDATDTGIRVSKSPDPVFPSGIAKRLECRSRRPYQRRQRCDPRSYGKLRSRDTRKDSPRESRAEHLRA